MMKGVKTFWLDGTVHPPAYDMVELAAVLGGRYHGQAWGEEMRGEFVGAMESLEGGDLVTELAFLKQVKNERTTSIGTIIPIRKL
ncbi:hypothetical protein IFM46972_03794 [Aspergillus udagawae]|uniref:Uncharacterized protein n=1 Tax=Aspergillus udagawae TaxID=91492 RepID=A0A8H3NNI7_9EURO|nr:hypothetical protein IFM46972_03794 [Aspergillus udagawae]